MSIYIDEDEVLQQVSTEELLYELETRHDVSKALKAVNRDSGRDAVRYAINILHDAGLSGDLMGRLDEWARQPVATRKALEEWLQMCGRVAH